MGPLAAAYQKFMIGGELPLALSVLVLGKEFLDGAFTDPGYEGTVPEVWRQVAAGAFLVSSALFIFIMLLFPCLVTMEATALRSDFRHRPHEAWTELQNYLDATFMGFTVM